jgi:hypothetical protein
VTLTSLSPAVRGTRAALSWKRLWRGFEEPDQFADGVVAVLWVAEWQLFVYVVAVAASIAGLREVSGSDEVVDDLRHRPLRDTDIEGDIPEASRTVARDCFQHVCVVRHESPAVVVVRGGLHRSLKKMLREGLSVERL